MKEAVVELPEELRVHGLFVPQLEDGHTVRQDFTKVVLVLAANAVELAVEHPNPVVSLWLVEDLDFFLLHLLVAVAIRPVEDFALEGTDAQFIEHFRVVERREEVGLTERRDPSETPGIFQVNNADASVGVPANVIGEVHPVADLHCPLRRMHGVAHVGDALQAARALGPIELKFQGAIEEAFLVPGM